MRARRTIRRMGRLWLTGFLTMANTITAAVCYAVARQVKRRNGRRRVYVFGMFGFVLNGGLAALQFPARWVPLAAAGIGAAVVAGVYVGELLAVRAEVRRGLDALDVMGRVVMLTATDDGDWIDAPTDVDDDGAVRVLLDGTRRAVLWDRRALTLRERVGCAVFRKRVDPRVLMAYDPERQAWIYRAGFSVARRDNATGEWRPVDEGGAS